jgi:ABC-2 type transport system ATP-binding protein
VFHLSEAAETFLPLVEGLPHLKKVQAIDNKLVVALDEPEIHNPDLIRQLVTQGANIQFVGELRHSLEDIYLQLVRDQ